MLSVHFARDKVQQAGHAVVHEHKHLGYCFDDGYHLKEIIVDIGLIQGNVQCEYGPEDEVGQIKDEPAH